MPPLAVHDDGPGSFRRSAEEQLDAGDHLLIDGIGLAGTRQAHQRHWTTLAHHQAVRQDSLGSARVAFHARAALIWVRTCALVIVHGCNVLPVRFAILMLSWSGGMNVADAFTSPAAPVLAAAPPRCW